MRSTVMIQFGGLFGHFCDSFFLPSRNFCSKLLWVSIRHAFFSVNSKSSKPAGIFMLFLPLSKPSHNAPPNLQGQHYKKSVGIFFFIWLYLARQRLDVLQDFVSTRYIVLRVFNKVFHYKKVFLIKEEIILRKQACGSPWPAYFVSPLGFHVRCVSCNTTFCNNPLSFLLISD